MKKGFIVSFICIITLSFYVYSQSINKELNEFVADLSSANVNLRGKLLYKGEYKDDLSKLTYNHYLELLKKNESYSNKGVTEYIRKADKHIFATKKNTFLIAIYSKQLNVVLYDDANTAIVDSVKVLLKNEKVPDLVDFISKTGFEIAKN